MNHTHWHTHAHTHMHVHTFSLLLSLLNSLYTHSFTNPKRAQQFFDRKEFKSNKRLVGGSSQWDFFSVKPKILNRKLIGCVLKLLLILNIVAWILFKNFLHDFLWLRFFHQVAFFIHNFILDLHFRAVHKFVLTRQWQKWLSTTVKQCWELSHRKTTSGSQNDFGDATI